MGSEPVLPRLSGATSAAIIALFLAVTLGPLAGACLAVFGEGSAAAIDDLVRSGGVARLLGRSVQLAGEAALLSAIGGIVLGASLLALAPRGRLAALAVLAIPPCLPPVVVAVGTMWIFGPAGLLASAGSWNVAADIHGAAMALAAMYTPVAAVLVFAGGLRLDEDAVDAARLSAGRARTFARILLPPLAPYAAAGALVVFVIALFNYAIPSLFRQNVLAVEMVVRFGAFFDAGSAAFLSLILAGTGLAAIAAVRGLVPFSPQHGYRAAFERVARRARPRSPLAVVCIAVFSLVAIGVPLAGQLTRLPPPSELPRIYEMLAPAFGYTCVTSLMGSGIAVALGFLWALQMAHGRFLRGAVAELFGILPFALPGPLLGIGLLHLRSNLPPNPVLDGSSVLGVAKGIACAPYAFVLLALAVRSTPRAELEALSLTGRRAAAPLVMRRVLIPGVCAFALSFCIGAGEADTALLLHPPGVRPLPIVIYNLYHFGVPGDVAVLCVVLALCAFATVGLAAAAVLGVARVSAPCSGGERGGPPRV